MKLLHSNAGDKCKRLPDNVLPRSHHVHTAIGLLSDIGRCGNVCRDFGRGEKGVYGIGMAHGDQLVVQGMGISQLLAGQHA